MSNVAAIMPILFFGAAIVSIGVAIEVFRRATLNSETKLLLLMVSTLGIEYILVGVDFLPAHLLVIRNLRVHSSTFGAACLLNVMFYAFGTHFLLLSARRLKAEWDWNESSIRFMGPFKRLSDERFSRVMTVAVSYILPFIIAVIICASPQVRAVITNPGRVSADWCDAVLNCFLGCFLGYYPLQWMLIQWNILNQSMRSPGARGRSIIARCFVDPFNRPRGTVLSLKHKRPLKREGSAAGAIGLGDGRGDEFMAFRTLCAGSFLGFALGIAALFGSLKSDSSRPLTLAFFLAPLLILPPLIYYKTRFIFFDIIIKRGSYFAIAALLSGLCFLYILYPLQKYAGLISGVAGGTTLCLGAVLVAGLCLSVRPLTYRALDQHLFRRPDYGKLILQMTGEIKDFAKAPALLEFVTQKLKSGLQADWVKFDAEQTGKGPAAREPDAVIDHDIVAGAWMRGQPIAAAASVATGDRKYGRLLLGNRLHGQQYQSEDISFLVTISDQVAGLLSNFELSRAREDQGRRERDLRDGVTKSEIRALRAHIKPDYLFHALSATKDLLGSDPKAAEQAIINLSNVFRFTLDATRCDWIRLGDEVELVRSYLDIQTATLGGVLTYRIDVPEELFNVTAPPLLIHRMIERAVGDALHAGNSCVRISLTARADSERIVLQIGDNVGTRNSDREAEYESWLEIARARINDMTGMDSLKGRIGEDGSRIVEFSLPRQPALPDPEPILDLDQ
jgi:hypothetical protein